MTAAAPIEGLPASLAEIPLEYFREAVRLARAHGHIDPKHVAMIGLSRGAEAALLSAANFPEITAVVAYSPAD